MSKSRSQFDMSFRKETWIWAFLIKNAYYHSLLILMHDIQCFNQWHPHSRIVLHLLILNRVMRLMNEENIWWHKSKLWFHEAHIAKILWKRKHWEKLMKIQENIDWEWFIQLWMTYRFNMDSLQILLKLNHFSLKLCDNKKTIFSTISKEPHSSLNCVLLLKTIRSVQSWDEFVVHQYSCFNLLLQITEYDHYSYMNDYWLNIVLSHLFSSNSSKDLWIYKNPEL
jgi:hypothetical protein